MDNNFHIDTRDSFRVAGYLLQTTDQRGEGLKAIPGHWARFRAEKEHDRLLYETEVLH